MYNKFLLPLLLILCIGFSSCQRALEDENIEYIGSWGSDRFSIEIWKNGRGVLERRARKAQECRVTIEDGKIKFRGEARRTFNIDEPPFLDVDGYWVMILDGDYFYLH